MNPLVTLWLIVLGSTIVLSGFFYLAENYAHIIGNFYFILGAFIGSYILYIVVNMYLHRNRKKGAHPK
ncbi:MAG: hypothetical protein ACE5GK_11925 [Nitrospiria bacterium]